VAKTEPRSLYGQVVAITGAARGIGKATARALARQGVRVGIGDLDAELARKAASELGGSVEAFELNVCDRAAFAM
jgi:NADP-dependent 3-hydroxy acid dehydrogenase YdfG